MGERREKMGFGWQVDKKNQKRSGVTSKKGQNERTHSIEGETVL